MEEFRAILVNVRQKISKICGKKIFMFAKFLTLGFVLNPLLVMKEIVFFPSEEGPCAQIMDNPGLGAPSSCLTAYDIFFFMNVSSYFLNLR